MARSGAAECDSPMEDSHDAPRATPPGWRRTPHRGGAHLPGLPDFPSYARLQPLAQTALASTALLLTNAADVAALVLTGLRPQRVWFVVFLLLVLASAYSPLLHMWDAEAAQQFDVTPYFLYRLSEQVLPAAVLALVALGYSV
jgi:hypothetical protein